MKNRRQELSRLSPLLSALLSGVFVFGLTHGMAAQAQEGQSAQEQQAEEADRVEEVVVTARKREEALQDVPFALSAKTEEQLRSLGAGNLEDLAHNVAGFTVQNLGPGQSQVAMRGISAGQIVRDQPGVKEQVGVYIDESVVSLSLFTPDLDLYDLNRVEVLRGPQGTLFGSGSLSGTVRYITNQPDLQDLRVSGEVSGSFLDGGDFGGHFKAMLNIPIAEDRAALRIAGYYTDFSGFIDAVQPNGGSDDEVNEGDRIGYRMALRIQPTDNLTITPRVMYQEVDLDGFNREDDYNILANPFTTTRPPVSLGSRDQFTQLEEEFTDDFLLIDGTIEYDFGPVVLTSITSFTDRDLLQVRDATQLTASITAQPDILDQPEAVYTLDAPLDDATDVETFTQELRLSYSGDRLSGVIGGFYSDIDRRYGQSLLVAGFEDATEIETESVLAGKDILFFSDIPYDFEQYAVFGEATYSLTDRLDFSAGVRWFDFEEKRVLNFDGIFADQTIGLPGKTTSDGLSPRFIVSYQLNEDIQLNAQVAKGFRLGGINDPLNVPLCSPSDLATFGGKTSFGDEELWNYEIGAKTTLFDGRARLNTSLFYSKIDDLQATLEAGTCSSRIVFNVPDARSQGVEFELVAQPAPGLDLGVAASWTDAELRSTVTSTNEEGVTAVVGGVEKGNRLPTTPKFQLSAYGTYVWPIRNDLDGFITGTYQHVGDRYTQIGDQAPGFSTVNLTVTPIGDPAVSTFRFNPKLGSYQIGNLRVGVRSPRWELALFVNNLWDERARLALDRERGGRARVGFLTNPSRAVGIMGRLFF